ncbi:MAG: hypothetical protein MR959_04020 [Selenomonas bovis]|nr:hypothetical protein [Selenomonas bovis]
MKIQFWIFRNGLAYRREGVLKIEQTAGVTSASGRMSAVRLREMESKAGGSIVAGHGVKHGGRVM